LDRGIAGGGWRDTDGDLNNNDLITRTESVAHHRRKAADSGGDLCFSLSSSLSSGLAFGAHSHVHKIVCPAKILANGIKVCAIRTAIIQVAVETYRT
jgi:hypothetical protein